MTSEEYDRLALQFYNETGLLAPGKDIAAAVGTTETTGQYIERLRKFTDWLQQNRPASPTDEEQENDTCENQSD